MARRESLLKSTNLLVTHSLDLSTDLVVIPSAKNKGKIKWETENPTKPIQEEPTQKKALL